jgi:hypothetical protein
MDKCNAKLIFKIPGGPRCPFDPGVPLAPFNDICFENNEIKTLKVFVSF